MRNFACSQTSAGLEQMLNPASESYIEIIKRTGSIKLFLTPQRTLCRTRGTLQIVATTGLEM